MSDKKRKECDLTVPECQPFDFAGGEHGVLLMHGFTGSCAHMRLLGEHLRDQGFTVKGIRLPGHGTDLADMAKADWKQWIAAAKEGLRALQERCKFVSVAGLSMGGCLTLILAEEESGITACAPISAPMAAQNKFLPQAKAASFVLPTIWWGENPDPDPVLDPAYNRGYSGFPTAKGADLYKLIRMSRSNLAAVKCPILVVQSHADETIAADSAEVILKGVSSTDKDMLWLEHVPHACTASREHAKIIADAVGKKFRSAETTR